MCRDRDLQEALMIANYFSSKAYIVLKFDQCMKMYSIILLFSEDAPLVKGSFVLFGFLTPLPFLSPALLIPTFFPVESQCTQMGSCLCTHPVAFTLSSVCLLKINPWQRWKAMEWLSYVSARGSYFIIFHNSRMHNPTPNWLNCFEQNLKLDFVTCTRSRVNAESCGLPEHVFFTSFTNRS